ncbi:MAG: hypothetical protein JWQ72_3647 [Polaromonas sp.]|nr:hypothetical protein [Polaromonas sp.]
MTAPTTSAPVLPIVALGYETENGRYACWPGDPGGHYEYDRLCKLSDALAAIAASSPAAPAQEKMTFNEFIAEAERTGLTAAALADALKARPEFADCRPAAPVGQPAWRSMDTAPTDGAMVRLLVDYSGEDSFTALEDELVSPTIGFNSDVQTGDTLGWQFVGWSWEQDCYCQGRGKVIGWAPFDAPVAHQPASVNAAPIPVNQQICQVDGIAEPKIRVACITLDGVTLAVRWGELDSVLDYDEQNTYTLTFKSMTQREYDALGEFNGF